MKRILIIALLSALSSASAIADTIILKNGNRIQTLGTWEEGDQIKYFFRGGIAGLPRRSVERIEEGEIEKGQGVVTNTETRQIEKTRSVVPSTETRQARRNYTLRLVASRRAVVSARWPEDGHLFVKIDVAVVGSNPKRYAKQLADKVSWKAARRFGRNVCVHVYSGNQRRLAKSCSIPED